MLHSQHIFNHTDENIYKLISYTVLIMKNFNKKLKYSLLALREKFLSTMLSKHLDTTFTNSTTKTMISSTETITFSTETEKNIKLVSENVFNIMKSCGNNPIKYIEYMEAEGTKVFRIKDASKKLQKINEDEGLITELNGKKALYMNFILGLGLSFTFKPALVMSFGEIEPYYMLREFYKWYSLKTGLPGFNFTAQENFKKYLKNINDSSIKNLNYKDMLELKEAIARDSEANEFVINAVKLKEGGEKVFKKMNDGGANI